MFIRREEYEALKEKKEYAFRERDYYEGKSETWENNWIKLNNKYEEEKQKVEELQKKNEELQHKIDILYAYYDINKDPTQEERTKIRLDLRVHELEMENLELRTIVGTQIGYLKNDLNRMMISNMNSICQVLYPYYNSPPIKFI